MTEEVKTTELFDAMGDQVSMEKVKQVVKISDNLNELNDWIQELASFGFEKIILHNVNRNQEQFIEAFGEHVLPELISAV